MLIDQLYKEYGRLVIQAKITNEQLQNVERAIAQELNKPQELTKEEPPTEQVKTAVHGTGKKVN